jgi:hypothetical protein
MSAHQAFCGNFIRACPVIEGSLLTERFGSLPVLLDKDNGAVIKLRLDTDACLLLRAAG